VITVDHVKVSAAHTARVNIDQDLPKAGNWTAISCSRSDDALPSNIIARMVAFSSKSLDPANLTSFKRGSTRKRCVRSLRRCSLAKPKVTAVHGHRFGTDFIEQSLRCVFDGMTVRVQRRNQIVFA
jgi:hypothetical protein